jgi:hypothetical protein
VGVVTAREFELLDTDGEPLLVRFDHSRAEPQWFDAIRGVGHPGAEPMVEITEINTGSGWVSADVLLPRERDCLEAQVLQRLEEIADDQQADRPEEA